MPCSTTDGTASSAIFGACIREGLFRWSNHPDRTAGTITGQPRTAIHEVGEPQMRLNGAARGGSTLGSPRMRRGSRGQALRPPSGQRHRPGAHDPLEAPTPIRNSEALGSPPACSTAGEATFQIIRERKKKAAVEPWPAETLSKCDILRRTCELHDSKNPGPTKESGIGYGAEGAEVLAGAGGASISLN